MSEEDGYGGVALYVFLTPCAASFEKDVCFVEEDYGFPDCGEAEEFLEVSFEEGRVVVLVEFGERGAE